MAADTPMPALVSRQEAMARGLRRYFTGVPCKRGHVAERHATANQGFSCVVCRAASDVLKREKHKAKDPLHYWRRHRTRALKLYYGMTMEDQDAMLAKQGGVCACCGQPPKRKVLCIDHCHATGKVRGMLCNACNTALFVLEHARRPAWEAYLSSHQTVASLQPSHS